MKRNIGDYNRGRSREFDAENSKLPYVYDGKESGRKAGEDSRILGKVGGQNECGCWSRC